MSPGSRLGPRDQAGGSLGGLHGLVNNAGIYQPKRLMETDAALWDRHMRVNQPGCFLGMKAVAAPMDVPAAARSSTSRRSRDCAAHPGVRLQRDQMGAARHDQVGGDRFGEEEDRVNSVHPGPIDTDMIAFARRKRTPSAARGADAAEGSADEVARLVLFLLSDESTYITGAEVADRRRRHRVTPLFKPAASTPFVGFSCSLQAEHAVHRPEFRRLDQRECATVTANSGPSSFACQKSRNSCSFGNFGNRS